MLDKFLAPCYNMSCSEREWRNRQTRTFEGRVFSTYGFKSRLSHQTKIRSLRITDFFSLYFVKHGFSNESSIHGISPFLLSNQM